LTSPPPFERRSQVLAFLADGVSVGAEIVDEQRLIGWLDVVPLGRLADAKPRRRRISCRDVVTVPRLASGTYYLFACADDKKTAVESNETNNCRSSATTVTIGLSPTAEPSR